jgi:hypothetical protein
VLDKSGGILGVWASAPIPESFTFGAEIEVVLHSTQLKDGGIHMAQSNKWWCSMRETEAKQNIMDYLLRMGISEGWK